MCVFLVVIGGVGRLNFFKYGLSNIAFPDQFWMSFVGCREEVCPPNIYLGYYVLDNGDSYSQFPSNVDQVVWFIFSEILVLILLPMLNYYSNRCVRARSLSTATKIKIMGDVGIYRFMV
jgi:hypothetical protein